MAFWLLQPESAHPARQGRAKVPTCSPASLLPGQSLWSLAPRGPWHTAICRDEGSKHRFGSSHSRASPGLCPAQHLLAGVEEFRSVQNVWQG